MVMSGIEDHLLHEGYFYLVASHHHRDDLIDEYPTLLLDRSVNGLIAADTPWHHDMPVPVVTVSGHTRFEAYQYCVGSSARRSNCFRAPAATR